VTTSHQPSPADQMRAIVRNHSDRRLGDLCGIHLFEDRIIKLPQWRNRRTRPDAQWITGVGARVEHGGRVVSNSVFAPAFGAAAGRTRSKPSELWIVIDGPTFQWQVRIPPRYSRRARKFVETVNTVSRLATAV
jgi:hypothetical protein